MPKQRLVICLIALSLSSSVVASAQIKSTPALLKQTDLINHLVDLGDTDSTSAAAAVESTDPQQTSTVDQNTDSSASVDTASAPVAVGTRPGTPVSKAPTSSGKTTGSTAATGYTFPSGSELTHYWLRNVAGPRAWIGSTFTASWHTWVDTEPTEWHRDFTGWSKRLGSSALDNAINQSSLVLLSRAMGQDPMYYRCTCTGFWSRTGHAFGMAFTARNHSGDRVFSPAKIIAPFTGPLVTRSTIYPDRFGPSDAFNGSAGAYYLIGAISWNWIREFIWKPHQ